MEVGFARFLIALKCTECIEQSVLGDTSLAIKHTDDLGKSKESVSLIRFSSL